MSTETAARFTLVGYFPKLVARRRDDWPMADNVEEICNVSACMSEAPRGWIERWAHNRCFFFDTAAGAREIAALDPRPFEVFAYRVLDRRFGLDGETPIVIPAVAPEPLPADWRMIGYDAVECTQGLESGAPVECSPLSCNALSREVAVNRYCLIDGYDRALDVARLCGSERTGVEPGPYYLFEVWRRMEPAHA